MKNELTCAVVRDLLPAYLEGLTSEETNTAVENHLHSCDGCTACRDAMAAPEAAAQEQAKEVDYLKTVKKRSRRRAAVAVLCTVLLFAAGAALKLFVIGSPASRESMSWGTAWDETTPDVLDLHVFTTSSAKAYCRWKTVEQDGIVTISGREVLVSPLYSSGDYRTHISLDGVKEIWLGGELLWQDGITVHPKTVELYESKTPYVGDVSALNRIIEQLEIRPNFGNFTHTLQTSSRPYRWTLEFSEDGWQGIGKDPAIFDKWVSRYALQMLALVENLEEVGWTYTDNSGEKQSRFITLEEANAMLPELVEEYNTTHAIHTGEALLSVKDYASSPANLQRLLQITNLSS